MSKLLLWNILRFSLIFYFCSAKISDKRLCVDPECNRPVSLAKTLARYFSPDNDRLSFGPNEDVVIFSKSAGSDETLWGAEIKGKRGYIPKNWLKETKIIEKPNLLVDTEKSKSLNKPEVPLKEEILIPTKVKENFEIIDGTTLYMDTKIDDNVEVKHAHSSSSNKSNVDGPEEVTIPNNPEEVIVPNNLNVTESTPAEDIPESVEDSKILENEVEPKENHSTEATPTKEHSFTPDIEKVLENIDSNNFSKEKVETPDTENESIRDRKSETVYKKDKKESAKEIDSKNVESLIIAEEEKLNIEENPNISETENIVNDSNNSKVESKKLEEVDSSKSFESHTKIKENKSELQEDTQINISEDSNSIVNKLDLHEDLHINIAEDSNNTVNKLDLHEDLHTNIAEDSNNTVNKLELHDDSSINIVNDLNNIGNLIKLKSERLQENPQSIPKQFQTLNPTVDITSTTKEIINSEPIVEDTAPTSITEEKKITPEEINQDITEDKPSEIQASLNISAPEAVQSVEEQKRVSSNIPENVNNEELDSNIKEDVSIDNEVEMLNLLPVVNHELKHVHSTENEQNSNAYPTESILKENNEQNNNIGKLEMDSNTENHIPKDTYEEINDINKSVADDDEHSNDSDDIAQLSSGNDNPENIEMVPKLFSYFGGNPVKQQTPNEESSEEEVSKDLNDYNDMTDVFTSESKHQNDNFCTKETCPNKDMHESAQNFIISTDMLNFNPDILLYLVTTAISVIVFLLGHFVLEKSRREGSLIVKINKLEKEFLILIKEKEALVEQVENKKNQNSFIETENLLELQKENEAYKERLQVLEDQVQSLEKELENSTEVGLELNRMLSEVLSSENAGHTLMSNIEGLQSQLAEQQDIVSTMKQALSEKENENHEITLELDIANKKVVDMQSELDKLLLNIIKLEEDKESLEKSKESENIQLNKSIRSLREELNNKEKQYNKEIETLNNQLSLSKHNLELKSKEYDGLKNSVKQIKEMKNVDTETLLEVNTIKAEFEQLKTECQNHCDQLQKEKEINSMLDKKVKLVEEQLDDIKTKFDETDKAKLELETKLQVLTNYFKDKEEQLLKELSKYENMWLTRQGEATSTSERIKYLQSEVQNYKAQNETLKQEIVSQEVELKGQISVLEKKVHENWVGARQAERRLEELKQEAAQLRNRLTLRERALQDDRLHNRMQSPLEQNEDIPISPLHLESPSSPPPLYNSRDHITKSPPILGMPPPFLPPPPSGGPFLPPPPLPFMPPPPHDMFPGDRRPPPLGRMSSPPLNPRYSPNRSYSPYDRSPSPSYDESEYGTSPVHRRNYNQFVRRRDHRSAAMDKFNGRSGTLSSGSDNSNESLEEMNHHQNSKV